MKTLFLKSYAKVRTASIRRIAMLWTALSVVFGFVLATGGFANAVTYTPSAVVTSVTALGTTGFADLIPIVLGVAGAGLLLIVVIAGARLVYKVISSRRHAV